MSYELIFGKRLKSFTELPVIENIDQRFKHLYMIGKPGTGKSSLIERLIQQDLDAGHSVIFIDPKGDSVRKLYSNNQDKNIKFVDFNHPIGLNPLKRENYSKDLVASEFADIINVMTSETSSNVELTVRMKTIITNLVRGVKDEDLNIEFFIKFLYDLNTRRDYKYNPNDYEAKHYWETLNEEKKSGYDKFSKFNLTMSSISERLSMFLIDRRMLKFLDSSEFNIDDLVTSGQSLFVDISSGLSESKMFLANLIVYSVLSYTKLKTNDLPLFVYVDEFQNCASKAFADALRACRSKNIGFTMAHQDFEAISEKMVTAFLSIVDNFVVFRVGYEESEVLSKFMGAKPNEIMDQPNFNAYYRSGTHKTSFFTLEPLEDKSDFVVPEVNLYFEDVPDDCFLSEDWI